MALPSRLAARPLYTLWFRRFCSAVPGTASAVLKGTGVVVFKAGKAGSFSKVKLVCREVRRISCVKGLLGCQAVRGCCRVLGVREVDAYRPLLRAAPDTQSCGREWRAPGIPRSEIGG